MKRIDLIKALEEWDVCWFVMAEDMTGTETP